MNGVNRNQAKTFKKLLEPLTIGRINLPNRMVMAAMGTALCDCDGLVTDEMSEYYKARASGGVGMVIVENATVDLSARQRLRTLAIDSERTLKGLSSLASVIKKGGAKAAIQLNHPGRLAQRSIKGVYAVGPSAVVPAGIEQPRALTNAEIGNIVDRYARGARLAKEAGFEGVEIHAAHHYLIAQFLSPAFNRRSDSYGRNVEGRAKFLVEVIDAVRADVGSDFPVWCRMNAAEFGLEDGLTSDDALWTLTLIEEKLVAVSVSAYGFGSFSKLNKPENPGALLPLAARVKAVCKIPVMAVGMITPEVGEQAIQEGKTDIVVLGRSLIADPELPQKVAAGTPDEISPCIACFACDDVRSAGGSVRCSVNAFAGREGQYRLTPSAGARKVLVVGGGPAGMEAARIAALRGDDVTLWEKEGALGGQLIQAAMSAHKHGIRRLVDYYIRQLTLRRVHVELRKEATPEKVIAAKANAVVVATGAFPAAVTIPGLSNSAITARQVLEGAKVGGARVVIIGGGMVGCETAEILLEMGKSVVIIEMLPELASTMRPTPRKMLLSRLAQKSVRICTSVECRKISDDGAVIWDRRGQYETIPFDTLVVAVGSRPDDRLFTALQEALPAVYRAGDCVRPRTIMEAVDEGMQAGLAVHASN